MEVDKSPDNFSNSSSDSSDSDSEKSVNSAVLELQNKVKLNPYNYDDHVNLITALRKAGELEKLRNAREDMSQLFPLTSELWLDWLIDEEKLAVTDEQKKLVISLFDRAVKDYASVNVWLEYCQYVIDQMGDESEIDSVRKIFDRALTAVGIHVTQGNLIWDAYREFESVILSSMQTSQTEADGEENKNKIEAQKKKLYTLYRRELSVPLTYMEKTYLKFRELTTIDPYTEQQYKKALKMLDALQPYEDAIYKSEAPHLEEYKRYIEFEKKDGNPARIQCIYERALIENCLCPELWCDYTKYVDNVIKNAEIVIPIHERAVRNCPWSLLCWNRYLLALERHNYSRTLIKDEFERSLMGVPAGYAHCQLWITYLDYLRRHINWSEDHESELEELDACFERAVENLSYNTTADPNCTIYQYWAKIKAKYCKDLSRAREIWSCIINLGHRGEADMWMLYANFEKVYGDDKHYRKVLLKGLQSVSDSPETLGTTLLAFEREEGTLGSLDSSTEKYEKELRRVEEQRRKIAEKESARLENKAKQRRFEHASMRKGRKERVPYQAEEKKKMESDVHMDSEGFKIPNVPSRLPSSSEGRDRVPNEPFKEHATSTEGKQRKRPAEQELSNESKLRKVDDGTAHGKSIKHDPAKDNRSVFLSNLSYDIDEDKIKETFSQVGDIEEVRLVKDYKGRSKGYCYIVFTSQDFAEKALEKDREFLDGRPMFVSPCEDKKFSTSQKKFKFGMGLEKNKLFVKGLPTAMSKEDLEEMFKEFGTLKEVRVVTYRNGHSKGLAYVEYENEASASAALIKTDGLVLKEHEISVAISNPPVRKTKQDPKNKGISISSLLGGGSSDTGPRGKGRTQLTLLPRALQRSQTVSKPSSNGANNAVQNNGSEDSQMQSDTKKLSNDDFRNMLLKK